VATVGMTGQYSGYWDGTGMDASVTAYDSSQDKELLKYKKFKAEMEELEIAAEKLDPWDCVMSWSMYE